MRPDAETEQRDHPHWRWRDQILAGAEPIADETVLDVGCGEGLVAFGALDRGASEVVFADISDDLLAFCRTRAHELGVLERCRFVNAAAQNLAPIEDASVDVVTTRSVLIYVGDKEAAFAEFARVLRSGGRLAVFEPINRFARTEAETWMGYDLAAVGDIARKVRAVYETIQPPDTDPMLDFDERDLIAMAERAGFFPIELRLDTEVRPTEPRDWEDFRDLAGNPRIPSLGEAMAQVLTSEEAGAFTVHLRPLVEHGRGTWRMATAHLRAVKPLS
jgi:ubiquinone/menaquinone biosynthesis C-methylase UbiE